MHEEWGLHNAKVRRKMVAAAERFRGSRFRTQHAAAILNTDIMSVMPYFAHCNWMPKDKGKRASAGAESEEALGTDLSSLQQVVYRAAGKKLRLLPSTPRACVFTADPSGWGWST